MPPEEQTQTETTETSETTEAAPSWQEGLSEEQVGFLSNKGFENTGALLKGYQELEAYRGTPADRLLTLPSDDAEPDAWNEVWSRLGAPEEADGYEFGEVQVPEGQQDVLTPWFREQAHKLRLPAKAATALHQSFVEMQVEAINSRNEQLNERDQTEMAKLEQSWGGAAGEKKELARKFIDQVFTEEEEHGLEDTFGRAWLTELAARLGTGVGEPTWAGTRERTSRGSQMSPGEAEAAITALKSDPEFMEKWRAGSKEHRAKLRRLTEMARPSTAGGPPRTFDPLA